MTEKFIVGVVGAPHGLKGFVKVKPFSGEIDHLLKLKAITLRQSGAERQIQIAEAAAAPPAILLRFDGIDTPEAAKALTGAELLVDRNQASPLAKGEYYIEDLKGLAVFADAASGAGEALGHITDIIEGGGGELAEIRLANGTTHLVPFRKEFFTEINPGKGRVSLTNLWVLE